LGSSRARSDDCCCSQSCCGHNQDMFFHGSTPVMGL
jgi:hypothetical protein